MHLAHAAPEPDGSFGEHHLAAHLREVSALAGGFAELFQAQDVARLAGLWHDLCKYRPAFQAYLKRASGYELDAHVEGCAGRVTHSGAGALLAIRRFKEPGRILAYLIAGHHAGLSDWHGGLRERLASPDTEEELAQALAGGPPPDILEADSLPICAAFRAAARASRSGCGCSSPDWWTPIFSIPNALWTQGRPCATPTPPYPRAGRPAPRARKQSVQGY
jgi:CRISPR-associated endonuclease Cas3-HD